MSEDAPGFYRSRTLGTDPRDIADVFAREPADTRPRVNTGPFLGFPPGSFEIDPNASKVTQNDDGTWTWHIQLRFPPHAHAPDGRPEVDPQPVR